MDGYLSLGQRQHQDPRLRWDLDRDWLLSPDIIGDRSVAHQQYMGRRSSHLKFGEHVMLVVHQSSTGFNGQAVALGSLFMTAEAAEAATMLFRARGTVR